MNKELKDIVKESKDIVSGYSNYKKAYDNQKSTFVEFKDAETSYYPEDIKDIIKILENNKKIVNDEYIIFVNSLIKHYENDWLVDQFDDTIPEFTYNM